MAANGARIGVAGLLGACCMLAACTGRDASSRLEWARAALERNPAIEVVAVDEADGVFTLRSKASGELRTVKLDELVAGPPPATSQPAAASAASATSQNPPDMQAAPEAAARPAALDVQAHPEEGGEAAPSAPEGQTPYTVERANGRLQITGPGISVASSGSGGARAPLRPGSSGPGPQAAADDPIVCEGRRFLRIDNRSLAVEGDAVIARGGCELYLTNSRVAASGRGIVAEGARVYVRNSTVEGEAASIDASQGADVYLQSSIMQGLARQLGGATVHDLGGNTWR